MASKNVCSWCFCSVAFSFLLDIVCSYTLCQMRKDLVYNGTAVDCSSLRLTSVESMWFPNDTTTLDLFNNEFRILTNGTFDFNSLRALQALNLKANKISELQVDCFRGLGSLKSLNLEQNSLQLIYHKFPFGIFANVPKLRELYIGDNGNSGQHSSYEPYIDIFDSLPNLRNLSIDTFQELHIGLEFSKLTGLKQLFLYANPLNSLFNNSLIGLKNISLEELVFKNCMNYMKNYEIGVLQYVAGIKVLRFIYFQMGNHRILQLLGPFENKSLSVLEFTEIHGRHYTSTPVTSMKDGFIKSPATRVLRTMCIQDFKWVMSKITAIEPSAFTQDNCTFMHCLKHLTFGGNLAYSLYEWKSMLLQILRFSLLEKFIYGTNGYDDVRAQNYLSQAENSDKELYSLIPDRENDNQEMKSPTEVFFADSIWQNNKSVIINETPTNESKSHSTCTYDELMCFYWPRTLKSLIIIYADGLVPIEQEYIVVNGEVVEEVYFVNSRFMTFYGKFRNLHNVRLLDISGSVIDWGNNKIYTSFPNLETFKINFSPPWMGSQNLFEQRLISKLLNLKHIEVSDNALNHIPTEVFRAHQKLRIAVFSKNRFTSLPFDIRTTPKLLVLDLSHNAILSLSDIEMNLLDEHVKKAGSLHLKLAGNQMACGCQQIKYIRWLQNSLVTFDQQGNYTCVTDDGQFSNTAAFKDLRAFWRHCVGSAAFWISLGLASMMMTGFAVVYMCNKLRTALLAFMLNVIAPQFRFKTPRDYTLEVFVGYADDDFRFIIRVLQPFLEQELGMARTFIHQRDLRGGCLDDQLLEAMKNSWRVLLLVTENFLHTYPQAHMVIKMSTACVTPDNPRRVFVLVQQELRHRVPESLLTVVDEQRIVKFHSLVDPLTNSQKLQMRRCLI